MECDVRARAESWPPSPCRRPGVPGPTRGAMPARCASAAGCPAGHVWGTCTRWTATPNTVARDGGVHTAAGLAISCGEGTRTSMRPRDLVGGAWQRHGAPSLGWYRPSVGVPGTFDQDGRGRWGQTSVSLKIQFSSSKVIFFQYSTERRGRRRVLSGGGHCQTKPKTYRVSICACTTI